VITVGSEESNESDLPVLDSSGVSVSSDEVNLNNSSADDLPGLDPMVSEAQNEVIEEAQAVEDSLDGEESTSDDS
jgi:hypothetical protein